MRGKWSTTCTPDNPAALAFPAKVAHSDNGIVTHADTGEAVGLWRMDGASTLHLTFVRFNYDANVIYLGTTTLVETDALDGETYQGRATGTITSPTGAIEATFGVTSAGQRVAE